MFLHEDVLLGIRGEFFYGFSYGSTNSSKIMYFLIHIIERELHRALVLTAIGLQRLFLQAICLADESAQMVAVDGMLEERLWRPYQHLHRSPR